MDIKVLESQNDIYQKQKLLGEGAFGKAYLVKRKSDGVLLVIKQMSIEHMSKQQKQQTIKEALILKNLNHPNITKFVEVYVTKQNKLKIVMEYAECGDLSKAIATHKKSKKYFEEKQIVDWFTQICLAIKHVHDRKILHRDIKGQNIFVTKNNILKLGDFGIARILNKTMDKARTVVGTPYYLSPEIIQNKPYSFKSDIWSIGVVLYELCALQHPFTATSLQFLALKIVKGSYAQIPSHYSKQLKAILSSMLSLDPNKRPGIKQILQNQLIQNRIRNFLTQTKHAHQFSHTVLHNQKVQLVSNRLVDIQQQKNFQKQRLKLKEEEQILKKKLQRQQSQQKFKQKRKQQEIQRQKQQEYRQKQIQRKKKAAFAIQQREKQQYEQRMRIARMMEKRQFQQREMEKKRLQHQQMLYKLDQRKEEDRRQKQNIKKLKKQIEEEKKQEQLKQFARKQYFQNQQIMRKARQRANQDRYQQSQPNGFNEPPIEQKRKSQNNFHYRKKQGEQDYQYENINQNSNKKQQSTPSSSSSCNNNRIQSKQKKVQIKQPIQKQIKNNIQQVKEDVQKKHSSIRQQMKRDKQMFLKNKKSQHKQENSFQQNNEISSEKNILESPPKLQAQNLQNIGKWGKQNVNQKIPQIQQKNNKYDQSLIDVSGNLIISPIEKQQFNQYLVQLQGILQNVHKNINACQKNQKQKFRESPKKIDKQNNLKTSGKSTPQKQISLQNMPIDEEIVFRDDGEDTLKFSLTAQFNLKQNQKESPLPNIEQSTNLDYFADYSKLQTLRMNLEDKFGTENFIQIYRYLQNQMSEKGLQGFNMHDAIQQLSKKFNYNLLMQNMTLLLTLIVMQQKMSAV